MRAVQGVHPDRVAGRHFRHRDPAGHHAARFGQGQEPGPGLRVQGQSQELLLRCRDVYRRFRRQIPGAGAVLFHAKHGVPGRGGVDQLHPPALVQRRCQLEGSLRVRRAVLPLHGQCQAFICPTFKTLAVRNSDDHFFAAETAKLKNYKPWYNYTMNAYLGSENSAVQKTRVKKDHGGQASQPRRIRSWRKARWSIPPTISRASTIPSWCRATTP